MFERIKRSPMTIAAAVVALFLVVGGTATAAKLITGDDIRDRSITNVDIKKKTLTGKEVRNGSLGLRDLNATAKAAIKAGGGAGAGSAGQNGVDGGAGATGQPGPAGPQGEPGPQGPGGVVSAFNVGVANHVVAGAGTRVVAEKSLPAGNYMFTANATLSSTADTQVSCVVRRAAGFLDLNSSAIDPSEANQALPVAMSGVVNLAAPGEIQLLCFEAGGDLNVADAELTAIPVAAIG